MTTREQLIQVTPHDMPAILERLEAEQATSLAIVGPRIRLSTAPNTWPNSLRGQTVYQLTSSWDKMIEHLIPLKHLHRLVIPSHGLGDASLYSLATHLRQLTSLNIGYNDIGAAGARAIAEQLTKLTSLDIGGNNIDAEGAQVIAEHHTELASLAIGGNNIGAEGAQAIAVHLTQLTSLGIWDNNIGQEGARVIAKHLTQLNSLDIGSNNIGDEGARAIAEHLTKLTSLDIWSNDIGAEGARVLAEYLTHLMTLAIWHNDIGAAGSRAIAKHLTQLNSLDIDGNNIGDEGARAIAEHLTQLTSLDIDYNNIGEEGARAIAEHLTQLNRLYISTNIIGDPGARAISIKLDNLKTLHLEHCNIGNDAIVAIGRHQRRLAKLSVADNGDVRDITPLTVLESLESLNLSNTSVTSLEPFADRILAGMTVSDRVDREWSGINVANCPLVRPTVEIVQQGPEAVRNYFRELAAQGEDYLYEAKVLILGEGGAGKTSLLRRLYQTDRELPQEDETTRGIAIHRHDFLGNHGKMFRLNVWDFGGQQIYHATHQFFLTKNSLYVLVDDTRRDDKSIHDDGFKFWLEVVETLSENSPLLIFQNEKSDRSKPIDQPGIQGRFTNVMAFYRGNLERPDSVKALLHAIECFVQQLPHIGEPVPKKWLAIRQELEQMAEQKPFISRDEYFAVYGRHLAFDRTKAAYLSRYLHDLGVFLHFQDDPLLSKTVILQNQWATEAVFRILDDETIKTQRGRFTAADCQRLWASSSYADMHFELRGLMEKFELCYRLAGGIAEQWLAPQLLSPSKPHELAQWARPTDLVVRFQYSFLPRGLVSRLMVRQHRFVQQLEKCWSRGAFFQHLGTEVLVEETAKGNEIELRARGPESKALLSVLSSDLELLNDSFKGLKGRVEKLVPCHCETCRTTTEPEMFKQSLLVERKHAGKKMTIECHKSGEDVSLLELLDGLRLDALPPWAAKPNKSQSSRTLKIFLASSAELRDDRDAFDLYFRQQNDRLKDQGVYLQIVRWEHFLDAVSETRLQDEYNKALRDCDIVVSLFKTKVGKFTEEEFEEAFRQFKATGRPRIFTYFRGFQVSDDDISSKEADLNSLKSFKEKLSKLGHFSTKYNDVEHLKRLFREQLEHLDYLRSEADA